MCGIAGYSLIKSGSFVKPSLTSALATLAHRGPDDSGIFEDSVYGIGLAHTRLSIIDLSELGHQPMSSPDGSAWIVFNGEIYNYKELRENLEGLGHRFQGQSDTEVILHLYLEYRKNASSISEMVRLLNGIFAIALWDRELETVFLVRDALGVKPLYYGQSDSGIRFASEIKALLEMDSERLGQKQDRLSLDASAVERYLTFLWCPGNATPLKGVKKVGPGEVLCVKQGQVEERIRWYLLPLLNRNNILARSTMSKLEAISSTEGLLRQAVHRQMISDVPVGAFLSGGLDSSSIVAFAREINPAIRCFTIETAEIDAGVTDDLPYARKVAAHLNVPLDVVRVDASRMVEDLPMMVAQLDEPIADPAALNVLYISLLAREQGIKVLLSGAGGDDLFTGYRRHAAVKTEGLWSWLPRPARLCLEGLGSRLDYRNPILRKVSKALNGAALSGDQRLINYFKWTRRQDLYQLYTSAFKEALEEVRPEEPMLDFLKCLPDEADRIDRILALEQRFFLADHNLVYADKMSMAAGVEVRVPFLDMDLMDFAARIPSRLKQRGFEGKWVLKKAMEKHLPNDVIYRPKSGFGAPVRRWVRGEMRELMADLLSERSMRERGLFEPTRVSQLISNNDLGRVDASYTLLSLMCVELWCRKYL